MATRPSEARTAPREVDGGRHGDLIVQVRDTHVQIRAKGKRQLFAIGWDAVYMLGVKAEAERIRAEQDKRKAARKAARR